MSRLLGPATWRSQPQIAVGIDRSSPLAHKLEFCYNGATTFDHARGVRPTVWPYDCAVGAVPLDPTATVGYCDSFSGIYQDAALPGKVLNFQGLPFLGVNITLFVRAYVETPITSCTIFSYVDRVSNRGFELDLSTTNISVWAADATTTTWTQTAGPTYSNASIVDIVAIIADGSPIKMYTGQSDTIYNGSTNFRNDNTADSGAAIGSYAYAGDGPLTGTVGCAMIWDRALSEKEVRQIIENPWQVFAPLHRVVIPVNTNVAVQFLRPISDISSSGWSASTGTALFAMLDETVRDDGDYIVATTVGATFEVLLGTVTDPASSVNHLPSVAMGANSGGIILRLKQGTTTIKEWTYSSLTTSPSLYQPTLSGAEIDSITDYTNLRLWGQTTA